MRTNNYLPRNRAHPDLPPDQKKAIFAEHVARLTTMKSSKLAPIKPLVNSCPKTIFPDLKKVVS